MALATSIIAALIGAAGAATAAGVSAIGNRSAAKKQVEAAKIQAGSTTSSKAAMTSAQLLSGNPNVLSSNTADNVSLSGRGRLLGN